MTSDTATTTVQVMCLGFKCPSSAMLRPDASELVCRRTPCAWVTRRCASRGLAGWQICCLSSCESFTCPEGYSKKGHAAQFSCSKGPRPSLK